MDKFLCWLLGHEYYVVHECTDASRKIACHRCGTNWGMNDNVRALIEWDIELSNFYKNTYNCPHD